MKSIGVETNNYIAPKRGDLANASSLRRCSARFSSSVSHCSSSSILRRFSRSAVRRARCSLNAFIRRGAINQSLISELIINSATYAIRPSSQPGTLVSTKPACVNSASKTHEYVRLIPISFDALSTSNKIITLSTNFRFSMQAPFVWGMSSVVRRCNAGLPLQNNIGAVA